MPELPEVHTTTSQLKKEVVGKIITGVWSDFHENSAVKEGTLKDPHFYGGFVSTVTHSTIAGVERRGKNILIHLDPPTTSKRATRHTVLIHMKMTGHLLFGTYRKVRPDQEAKDTEPVPEGWEDETWIPVADENSPLWDPYNRFIHLVFSFADGSHLVLSDVRKFAKVTLLETDRLDQAHDLADLGPDLFDLTEKQFAERIHSRRSGKIKTVLMDQSMIAGVGNIYSDEALWLSNVHPETDIQKIDEKKLINLYRSLKKVMEKAIQTGGDSDSDYRNLYGEKGRYQNFHNVYRQKGKICPRQGCEGTIKRIIVGSRGAHYCPRCQKK